MTFSVRYKLTILRKKQRDIGLELQEKKSCQIKLFDRLCDNWDKELKIIASIEMPVSSDWLTDV